MSQRPLVNLSDDLIYHIIQFLEPKDVPQLLSTSKHFYQRGEQPVLWKFLLKQLSPSIYDSSMTILSNQSKGKDQDQGQRKVCSNNTSSSDTDKENAQNIIEGKQVKTMYIQNALASDPSKVRWKEIIESSGSDNSPIEREGHIMAKLGTNRIVLTGGYCTDFFIYVLDIQHTCRNTASSTTTNTDSSTRIQGWKKIRPQILGKREVAYLFAYGCSLTAIDDKRMVRFGGFQSGGYSGACNQILLLIVEGDDDDDSKDNATGITAKWKLIDTKGNPPDPRAYHTATFVAERFIVILGGIFDNRSIISEAILDTQTWTWIDVSTNDSIIHADVTYSQRPTGRYGHSVILDENKNRLVLFGGANGCDLLREGIDNAEVWELSMKNCWKRNISSSLPWKWNKIHHDGRHKQKSIAHNPIRMLTALEQLMLARCHISVQLSSSRVMFFSGGGQISTNELIVYDLVRDEWKRLTIEGMPPAPRFTAVGVVMGGWFIAHGGYTCGSGALGDLLILDLAPALNRSFEICSG